jgi:glycosyltransferase involved in cell wall biosynthesis
MRILVVHNHYGQYAVGGEANVMGAEVQLLQMHGHEVMKYERTNAEIENAVLFDKLNIFKQITWSQEAYEAVGKIIDKFHPDLMHVHNYWFLLTPSIFAAARDRHVATVLTLHNYRMVCPGNQLLRNNKVCELCLKGNPWRILWHRCYPDGSIAKSFLSLMLYLSTRKKSFLEPWVDAYIALTEFGKQKFIEGGMPHWKIHVKPNFMADPLNGDETGTLGHGAIFVGRISQEKGLFTLMRAWEGIDYPLMIVGDGPLIAAIKQIAPPNVQFLGQRPHEETLRLISEAAIFIFPSDWYEGFPLTLLEAMALGRAVLASDLGPRCEMLRGGKAGLLFQSGDPNDLQQKVRYLIANPAYCIELGKAARQVYLEEYTPDKNYLILMSIYKRITTNIH